jgi:hypothetical protein
VPMLHRLAPDNLMVPVTGAMGGGAGLSHQEPGCGEGVLLLGPAGPSVRGPRGGGDRETVQRL